MRIPARLILVALLLRLIPLHTAPALAQGSTVKIPDGTLVRLALLERLSSATNRVDGDREVALGGAAGGRREADQKSECNSQNDPQSHPEDATVIWV